MADSYWNSRPDLTRLPEALRQSLTKSIPIRPAEIVAQTIVFPVVAEQGLNHPNGRLRALIYQPKADSMQIDGLQLETSTFTGHRPIYVTIVKTADCPEFLRGAITSYVRACGNWDSLNKIVEELKCNSPL